MMSYAAAITVRLHLVVSPAASICLGTTVNRLHTTAPALISRFRFGIRAPGGDSRHMGTSGSVAAFSTEAGDNSDDEQAEESSKPKKPSKWMVVGLGNPGSKFQGTRHNVGFEMIDQLALQEGIKLNTIQCKAVVGRGQIEGVSVLLVKPQTYMNLSGDAVSPLALYYRVPIANVLVVYDDMDLDVAIMKLAPKGGPGGHNGMRHIIEKFKSNRNVPRLRIGIGRPPGSMDPKAYVLQKFTQRERSEIDICFTRGADAVRLIMAEGFDIAVSKWNPPRRSRDPTAKAQSAKED